MRPRQVAFQAQSVTPVEDNPDFAEALCAATAGAPGVVLGDGEGSSLERRPSAPWGIQGRSLVAAYRLLAELGYAGDVRFLEGGWNEWFATARSRPLPPAAAATAPAPPTPPCRRRRTEPSSESELGARRARAAAQGLPGEGPLPYQPTARTPTSALRR